MRSDVTLHRLDRRLLAELLDTAVADAEPAEVMPPVPGPAGWTPERRAAFLGFHRARSLAAEPVEATFAVVVGRAVAGAARLCPLGGPGRTAEAGVWIGRSHRGGGVAGAVLPLLRERARVCGYESLLVSTTPDNTAVHRLVRGLGAALVHDGGTVTARIGVHPGERPPADGPPDPGDRSDTDALDAPDHADAPDEPSDPDGRNVQDGRGPAL